MIGFVPVFVAGTSTAMFIMAGVGASLMRVVKPNMSLAEAFLYFLEISSRSFGTPWHRMIENHHRELAKDLRRREDRAENGRQ